MRDEDLLHAGPSRGQFVAGGAAAFGALVAGSGAVAAQGIPLRLNIFGGLDAWPIYVIKEKGLLAGYDLSVTATTGSVLQVKAMMAGDADVALTAMDNVIAYDEGEGAPSVPGPFDFAAFLGIGPGFLRLLVTKDITSYAQLRGKAFAVDAVGTGFTFVLRRMLQKKGIMPGEYTLVPLGSTQKRFDGMVAGQCVGAVVGAPFDVLGEQKYGFHVLDVANDVLGHYQATVMMARRSWSATHRPAILALIKAYRSAVAWLYDPANRTEAVAILAKNTHLPLELLTQIAPGILATKEPYSVDGAFDVAGVATVVELRSAYITPKKTFGDTSKYIDRSFL
jgi:ABC-type nitrate/sulfonate/bicarbonate transport system substrate-binding protein